MKGVIQWAVGLIRRKSVKRKRRRNNMCQIELSTLAPPACHHILTVEPPYYFRCLECGERFVIVSEQLADSIGAGWLFCETMTEH